jgi:hypothetical protein
VSDRQRRPLFWAYVALLTVEAAGMAVLAVTLLIALLTSPAVSEVSGVALVVLAFLAVAWIVAIVVGVLRGQAWTRAASVVWQVLQGAIGIGAVQGALGGVVPPTLGWPLVAVAVAVLLLGISKTVVAATSARAPRADPPA